MAPTWPIQSLSTVFGAARAMMTGGLAILGVSATSVIVSAITGHVAEALAGTGTLMVVGAALFTVGAARLALSVESPAAQELEGGEAL